MLFMDDDNYAKPHEISTFVRAAQSSGADVLTCWMDVFESKTAPRMAQRPTVRWLPIGGAVSAGLYKNCFGDANALVRRSAFLEAGGFTEDYGVGHEDWEFFAKMSLGGYKVSVVPEALFWYRRLGSSMLTETATYQNLMRGLRPYMNAAPRSLKPALLLALSYQHSGGVAGPGWQAPEDTYVRQFEVLWASTSWRITRPWRNLVRLVNGQGRERKPPTPSNWEAKVWIDAIHGSTSWEITGPLRTLGKVLRRLGGS